MVRLPVDGTLAYALELSLARSIERSLLSRLLFDHSAAQAYFGASIFWLRLLSALPNEEEAVLGWQLKRDGSRREIVEITEG